MLSHQYTSVNGLDLHFVSSGEGKLILFLHGFPEFWYAWKAQLEEFGKDHRAVALDMRGYNLSSKPKDADAYAMPHLVEDVRLFAAAITTQKYVLVGHDWGGVVAWTLAALYPDTLDALVIINAPHPAIFRREIATNPAQRTASAYMAFLRTPAAEFALSAANYALLVKAVMGKGLQDGSFSQDDRQAYIEAWSQPGALTGGLNYYRATRIGPPSDSEAPLSAAESGDLPPIRVPTLVLWGEKDEALLIGNLNGLEDVAPGVTIRRIPDGTHWVVHEQPERINSAIRDFLEGMHRTGDRLVVRG